jgi:hypothetical protein
MMYIHDIFLIFSFVRASSMHPANSSCKPLTIMELELESNIIGSASKNILKHIRKSRFGNWTTKIDPIQSKLKDKKIRGHGKSCLRAPSINGLYLDVAPAKTGPISEPYSITAYIPLATPQCKLVY